MTKREKILAGLVGGVLLIVGLQYGFSKYRSAVKTREAKVDRVKIQVMERENLQLEGAMAQARMGEHIDRSLPSDLETAKSLYNQFLSQLLDDVKLSGVSAKPTGSIGVPDLYTQLNFNVSGAGKLEQIVELLHKFHSKNYLHRIQTMSVRKQRSGVLNISMDVQVLALQDALPDATPPDTLAARVNPDLDYYRLPIMNRNPIAPPNRRPTYAADRSVKAEVGQRMTYTARFNDPDDGQNLSYSLVGDAPEGVRLDPSSGTISLSPNEVGEIELLVAVKDNGWPQMSAEQRIVFNVVEPAPEEKAPEPPKFDEATQTYLTGLTQSRGRWMAMLHVRTRDETLKLVEGDTFEIGQLKGKVVEVTQKYAVLETDGETFVLSFDTSLAAAKTNGAP
jgi:hypothetical protein